MSVVTAMRYRCAKDVRGPLRSYVPQRLPAESPYDMRMCSPASAQLRSRSARPSLTAFAQTRDRMHSRPQSFAHSDRKETREDK